jgi:S-adenosyl-L-methionine hydrolase (adenosine-forming)
MLRHGIPMVVLFMRPLITLTTDFGIRDAYVALMHGVILGICREAQIVDITHAIPPQDIVSAALLLPTVVRYFPPGSIHVVVVDPGVGSERRAVALEASSACFVGPDNGVLSLIWEQADFSQGSGSRRAVALAEPRFWLPEVSSTFHGRDIFAPVAAHLACGAKLADLGPPVTDLLPAPMPRPLRSAATTLEGEIIIVDHFGNCISNISRADLEQLGTLAEMEVSAGEQSFGPIRRTYADVAPGERLALFDSNNRLECARRNGNAAVACDLRIGSPVRVRHR